ncbi:uncharacterized protein J4E87_008590 [Alternaria ethzedia]|uniref:uncharacterized protein n=1 Tax=Alternaria ethzedia TaxID=181014 RepID=UPI0020C4CA6D|nr:uncharacterized protein J4E87_008590 [Alternaria ethzedia]KAI4617076.1 hypothetical protein J4E87_008590 [Alternaria ethzedia]
MERLSEELLDHVVSEVINPLPNRHTSNYDDLLNLSLVSRKFCRITEPYIYRSLIFSGDNGKGLLRTFQNRPDLLRYVRAVYAMQYDHIGKRIRNFIMDIPSLQELDLNIWPGTLSSIVPVLKLQTLKTLRLSGVAAGEIPDEHFDDWEFENNTLSTLDISFTDPKLQWELCDEIQAFAEVFLNLRCLRLHSNYEGSIRDVLDGTAFRYLIRAFKHSFETTLRELTFEYNHPNDGFIIEEDEAVSGHVDVRDIIKDSRLEKLRLDTICLHKPMQEAKLRSLALGPSCLPTSLRTLYLRHIVATGNLNPYERDLMHSDEAQCLSQLVNLGARRSRFPHLQNMTLAICLPPFFEDVASRVVKVQARKVKVQLDLMFM